MSLSSGRSTKSSGEKQRDNFQTLTKNCVHDSKSVAPQTLMGCGNVKGRGHGTQEVFEPR